MLFFDPRLSAGQNISCSSCHNPSFGWEVPVSKALGAANTRIERHAPTIINAAWISPFFWDGRANSLEEQAMGPITAPLEMNSSIELIIQRLSKIQDYQSWFNELFPSQGVTKDTILHTIATYERTIVAGWSNFDRWVEGDDQAISLSAKRGFKLFNGKAGCANCHVGWNFTDNAFHRIGVSSADIGHGNVQKSNNDLKFTFKTPGLRNIALRAPYMHNGSLPDLRTVIHHYSKGGEVLEGLESEVIPFEISDIEVADIISFLSTLSDNNSAVPTPILPAN